MSVVLSGSIKGSPVFRRWRKVYLLSRTNKLHRRRRKKIKVSKAVFEESAFFSNGGISDAPTEKRTVKKVTSKFSTSTVVRQNYDELFNVFLETNDDTVIIQNVELLLTRKPYLRLWESYLSFLKHRQPMVSVNHARIEWLFTFHRWFWSC